MHGHTVFHHSASVLCLLCCYMPTPNLAEGPPIPSINFPLHDSREVRELQKITVPFEYFGEHIYVTLTINGTAGMVFLVDTGTSANILNLHTSQALGLKPENVTRTKDLGLGGGKVSVAAARNLDVDMGDVQVANILALVDLSGLENFNNHRTDGILGFPLLKRFVVEFDFQQHLLTLYPIKRYRYRGPGEVQYLSHKDRFAAIPVTLCTTDHRRHDAMVEFDTGSDATLMLYPEFARRAHLEDTFRQSADKKSHDLKGYGIGGFFPLESGELRFMAMRNTEITALPIFLIETNSQLAPRKQVSGIVGTSILNLYRKVIFDIPGGRIILERRNVPAPRQEIGMTHFIR